MHDIRRMAKEMGLTIKPTLKKAEIIKLMSGTAKEISPVAASADNGGKTK
jgi:hypothetical protein